MEKEDALKAGHWVEPFRGMQLWGAATGMKTAIAVRSAVEASDAISFAFVCRTARSEYKRRLSERAMDAGTAGCPREDARALRYRSSLTVGTGRLPGARPA